MARFELLDDGSRACVLRLAPIDLPQAEAVRQFDRHVADVRARHEDRFVTQVRVEWIPQSAPRDYYDLIAASCSSCARFVLTLPMSKLDDIARLGAFDIFVLRLLNGCALSRKHAWHVRCFQCSEERHLSAARAGQS